MSRGRLATVVWVECGGNFVMGGGLLVVVVGVVFIPVFIVLCLGWDFSEMKTRTKTRMKTGGRTGNAMNRMRM